MDQIYNHIRLLSRQQDDGGWTGDGTTPPGSDSQDVDGGQELLKLLHDPFSGALAAASIYSALGISLGFTAFIAICFSLLRPYHQAIYAPKLKHADEKHAPPPIGKQPWAWISPLINTKEEILMQQIGMDATIFLRFINMCRDMFLVLAVVGVCILVPVNWTKSATKQTEPDKWILQITPLNVWDPANWAQVVVAWLFDAIVCAFLWWNYRKVLLLRRNYFGSDDYQNSLHSRTLMLFDLPKQGCSDEGIARIIDEVAPSSSFARTAIARNVKDLPELIKEHEMAVRRLEKFLARYLRNPDQLPANRPVCKPSKYDRSYENHSRGSKVDAIDYYTQRIRTLEFEIKEARKDVNNRSTMPYGFASYSDIAEAHNIAYACRKKKPHGAIIKLAPRPNDVIWTNMPLSSGARGRRRWINALWVTILTVVWIGPNAMIAIFLVNLANLGKVWPAFQRSLEANTNVWGAIQGIVAPALTSLVYLVLPIIFRRLAQKAGDQTKTGRERHVLAKLYAFFIFNNLLVFSLFNVIWSFISGVVAKTSKGTNAWDAIQKQDIAGGIFTSLCNNSPFWVTYLLQRQLGAALDLSQLWPLIQAFFLKTFSHPTPRELIELTAPPPFEYASYYNYFIFYATVTLCYAGIQPLVLVATAMYFFIDSFLKKYLILYRFVTKTESGGLFWRVLVNRMIFATILSNLVVLLTCWVRGDDRHIQFFAVIPLPFLMIGFKFYCKNAFDEKITYFSTRGTSKNTEAGIQKESRLRSEKLAMRFGHPALYKALITPMVHQRAQNMLPAVYKGRLSDGRDVDDGDLGTVSGYSDMVALDSMQGGRPGKRAKGFAGFEYVSENHMDFEFYKNRAEFAEEHGGGEIYGRQGEITRPETPGYWADGSDRGSGPSSPVLSGRSTPLAQGNGRRAFTGMSTMTETSYQPFRPPPSNAYASPAGLGGDIPGRSRSPFYGQENSSAAGLVQYAAAPGSRSRNESQERGPMRSGSYAQNYEQGYHASPQPQPLTPGPSMGALGGGPQGYSGLAQVDNDGSGDAAQYDYFRGGNRARRPGEGW